ncbi:hypothetical protein [Oceanospirillum linum]|uniref:Wadjet protein JetD C-terminal domain-containing protein n=1 Tax=Oceanospirillum linum TaxID=966 RepID=A0A1T1HAZ7_OCELI|nr:hypothetical protein [Oceanospirillum linum]OOV87029.1 hypothetical protein BTA35_0208435 [Oceanospirillum linum]SEF72063.1 hypothetical protein SAMN04489856_10283 [Oleiphilus messinensis]SMP15882.1 hypothetical protein SAMN06264348_10381 [Oceanospirillum linum]
MSDQPELAVDWQSQILRDAAIGLFKTERIRRDVYTGPLISELLELEWLSQVDNEDVYTLTPKGRHQYPKLLDQNLPQWQELALSGMNMQDEERDAFMRRLEFIRANTRFDLPVWINRKSFNTLYGGDEKTQVSDDLQALLPKYRISEDAMLRIRGTTDMHLMRKMLKPIRLGPILQMMSHAAIPERDVMELTEVDGEQPYMVMTVENLSVFADMDIPDHLMLIWAPLNYPDLAIKVLKMIPQYVPHIHFGDLDPSGLALAEHIAGETGRPVRRFLPEFWQEYMNEYAQPCVDGSAKGSCWQLAISSNALIRKLMLRKEWMPQSVILLDPRLRHELLSLMN